MNTNDESTKRINRIVRPIITLIIATVLMLIIPILSGVVALPFLLLGQQIAYIVSRLIQNLYGPLIIIILITIFPVVSRMILAVRTGGVKIYKPSLKNTAIMLFMLILGVNITFNCFKNITKLILDIGIIATSNYGEADGKLELYEVTIGDGDYTFMEINSIKFDGGNVQAGELIEGDYYHVEYLPHTKYVVKYKRLK